MNSDFVKTIFEFQIAEDQRLWHEVILPLDENLFKVDTGYSWGSLQRECVHVVDVMHTSLERIHGILNVSQAFTTADPDLAQVRATWDVVEDTWKTYMRGLDDQEFHRQVDVIYRDKALTLPVWNMIFHVFNHNTLHRTEMLQIVASLNEPPNFDTCFARFCLRNAD